MSDGEPQSTLRELHATLLSPRYWLTVGIVVLVFWITGPFGTLEAMGAVKRLAFWLLLQGAAFAIATIASAVADRALAGLLKNKLARMMIGSALAAAPIGAWIVVLQAGLMGDPVTLDEFIQQTAVSLPLCILFCLLIYLTASWTESAPIQPTEQSSPTAPPPNEAVNSEPQEPPAILARLKPETRGRLLRLSVQDHYTEVVTSRGRDLILLRFSDAIKETGATPGLRVHRSHWVADDIVRRLSRGPNRLVLELADGSEIPVSRTYAAEVRDRFGDRG
ncbi:DNA-binding LytR/AlgR family response regulator [Rhizobium sp. SG_E_25_P2]|uniref:LytTR family DNA-binding domain-containing protein n=1 Tax=Rhizobium sp. SG_E_25_P2 TaxID=2879942 RepID=UPI002475109E|nr:LytTR family DNA-binding domain-containing protein [Rhizobium sp. SG_E_25_P2]MDH6266929.1 DNA-binding LytR/AlgR family response regulator [Rhizobium sp. SG_E_25_P2]